MKIVLLPEADIGRNEPTDPTAGDDPARPADRVAGPAYVFDVDVAPVPASDELTPSEWSAFVGLS
jgi:hypothetical protein